MKKRISISSITLLLICFVSCKTSQTTIQKEIVLSLKSANTVYIMNSLNQILSTFSSLYDPSKAEKGYLPMYKKFTDELLKTKCIKELIFMEGVAKSLPPQKSFKMKCLVDDKNVSYLGVILLSEIPKMINLTKEEPLK